MIHEQVDDLPVLLALWERLGVSALLDQHFPPHGNWRGCSLGTLAAAWLTHILSQGDHRLHHVQTWAAQRLHTLHTSTGVPLAELDFTDDRLAALGRRLSAAAWNDFEDAWNQQLLRVYELQPETVRLDATTVSSDRSVNPEGLFQMGVSKDHRPDLPQLKLFLATLDPLGLPLVTTVLPGQRADDPLYLPAVERVRQGLGRRGVLYVGDCKLASLETRAGIYRGDDYYLCPLAEAQLSPAQLERYLEPVWAGTQPLLALYADGTDGTDARPAQLAEGFELAVPVTVVHAGKTEQWTERHLVVRSLAHAAAATQGLERRLTQARATLEAQNERGRGRSRFVPLAERQAAAAKVLARYRVAELLRLEWEESVTEQVVRRYAGRPETVRVTREFRVQVTVDEVALARVRRLLGWRVYATNAPAAQLSWTRAVQSYREQYQVERGFARLKGRPLSLRPLYLQREDHVTGLVRLLTVALRGLCLLEYEARQGLARQGQRLAGLYAGNPKRTTARPTAELLLAAFRGIAVIWGTDPGASAGHLSRFSAQHAHLLGLWNFSACLYTQLTAISKPVPKMGEP